jgi:hypothetical protein
MDRTQDFSTRFSRGAAELQRAGIAVLLARAVSHHAIRIDAAALGAKGPPILAQPFPGWATVGVLAQIVGKILAAEGPVAPTRLVDDRYAGLNLLLLHQPCKRLGRSVAGVGNKPLRVEIEAVDRPFDRVTRGLVLGLVVGAVASTSTITAFSRSTR